MEFWSWVRFGLDIGKSFPSRQNTGHLAGTSSSSPLAGMLGAPFSRRIFALCANSGANLVRSLSRSAYLVWMWQAMAMAASDTRAGWHPNAIA